MGPSVALILGAVLQWAALSSLSSAQGGCRRGGGVDSMLQTQVQREARELQHDLSCYANTTARDLFEAEIRRQFGISG